MSSCIRMVIRRLLEFVQAFKLCPLICLISAGPFLFGDEWHVELERTVSLPDIVVDGEPVHAHTQGLHIDSSHIYVTARLERKPKTPIFVRFDRSDTSKHEVMNLSNVVPDAHKTTLDHPGGFGSDSEGSNWEWV